MIYEYALDPELIAEWIINRNNRIAREFDPLKGRLMSNYPRKWVGKVKDSLRSKGVDPAESKAYEAIMTCLSAPTKKRISRTLEGPNVYDGSSESSWLKNALHEHQKKAFKAILTNDRTQSSADILTQEKIDETLDKIPSWDVPTAVQVKRNSHDMAALVAPLLSSATIIKFIDPYILKNKRNNASYTGIGKGYKDSLSAYFAAILTNRRTELKTVEIHTKADNPYPIKEISSLLPDGLKQGKLSIFIWEEREGGPKFHNRYIITDIGAVSFHHGLDSANNKKEQYDDVNIIDSALYSEWFSKGSQKFDLVEDPIHIP